MRWYITRLRGLNLAIIPGRPFFLPVLRVFAASIVGLFGTVRVRVDTHGRPRRSRTWTPCGTRIGVDAHHRTRSIATGHVGCLARAIAAFVACATALVPDSTTFVGFTVIVGAPVAALAAVSVAALVVVSAIVGVIPAAAIVGVIPAAAVTATFFAQELDQLVAIVGVIQVACRIGDDRSGAVVLTLFGRLVQHVCFVGTQFVCVHATLGIVTGEIHVCAITAHRYQGRTLSRTPICGHGLFKLHRLQVDNGERAPETLVRTADKHLAVRNRRRGGRGLGKLDLARLDELGAFADYLVKRAIAARDRKVCAVAVVLNVIERYDAAARSGIKIVGGLYFARVRVDTFLFSK